MNCLSSSGRKLRWKPVSKTERPGKLNEAPLFCVERKTKKPLARSGSPAVAGPRLNIWHDRYALPLLSQPTDVSPLACQYSRGYSGPGGGDWDGAGVIRSEEHTSELQS